MNTAHGVWIALLAALFLGDAAPAKELSFKNDLRGSVVVQTVTVIRGVTRRDKPELLAPGETSSTMPQDGDKIITVYDGRSNRILYRNTFKVAPKDCHYSITIDPRLGKVVLVPRRVMPGGP
jgi:hypothetical protein